MNISMPKIISGQIYFSSSEERTRALLTFDPELYFVHNKDEYTPLALELNKIIDRYPVAVMELRLDGENRFTLIFSYTEQLPVSRIIGTLNERVPAFEVRQFLAEANKIFAQALE